MDGKLRLNVVNSIRIFVLGTTFASKFGLSSADDYLFLDNLYVNEAGFSAGNKLAQRIKSNLLELVKLGHNYKVMLNENKRDFVSYF